MLEYSLLSRFKGDSAGERFLRHVGGRPAAQHSDIRTEFPLILSHSDADHNRAVRRHRSADTPTQSALAGEARRRSDPRRIEAEVEDEKIDNEDAG